jgi:hypothetical protein
MVWTWKSTHRSVCWIFSPQLVALFWEGGSGNFRRWGLVGRSGSPGKWKITLDLSPFLALCFLSSMRWTAACSSYSLRHNALPHNRSKNMESSDHKMNPLKLWTKTNLSSFWVVLSGPLSQQWEKSLVQYPTEVHIDVYKKTSQAYSWQHDSE